ncbi:MAG: DUF86 domain-containing protein [Caldisericia bacterium]|nr:DUF86 domain-containing protein [Caldisericia bacterium]
MKNDIQNMNFSDFLSNGSIQDAVIRQFEIIGEESKHISESTTRKIIDVPWKDIISMRNILIHDYFEVDLEDVWQTAENDIKVLKEKINKFLEKN